MIKLVGFSISGIPKHNDRNDRRNNDQTGEVSKTGSKEDTGKEMRIATKRRSELQRE